MSVNVAKFCLSSFDSFSFIEYCFKGSKKHPKHCDGWRKMQSDTDLCSLGSMKIGYNFLTNIEITFDLPWNPMHQSWFTLMAFKPTLNTDLIKAPPDGFPWAFWLQQIPSKAKSVNSSLLTFGHKNIDFITKSTIFIVGYQSQTFYRPHMGYGQDSLLWREFVAIKVLKEILVEGLEWCPCSQWVWAP